jgi:ribose transport system ATP-binding protein
MQMVEIAKALSLKARLIIMDEPTSSLTASETERLLAIVSRLRAEGVSIIFISHRLAEVERCADRVVVLRDGKRVAELGRNEIRADTMIRFMIGRDLKTLYRPPAKAFGEPVLELVGVKTGYRPEQAVSLAVRKGEILGLAGLVGSGRTELARALFGIDPLKGGEIRIDGERASIRSPRDAIERGIYLVPEDRKRSGLILDFPIRENITLASLPAHARYGIADASLEDARANEQRKRLDIRCRSVSAEAGSLSGGNQQKVVLAKWLSMAPRMLIFDEPTRGVDVGAKNEIYRLMRELADHGVGILMISSDMEEVIGVSDRVAVMHEGRIAGFLERQSLSEQAIMSLAVGRIDN